MTDAVEGVSGPVAAIDLGALRYNALDMVVRAGGVPIRVASKSVRVREVDRRDARDARAITESSPSRCPRRCGSPRRTTDVVLGYPSVDRAAIAALAADERAASRVTLMVDDLAQLDARRRGRAADGPRATLRVAIDADASWRAPGLGHIGVHRSPVHEPAEVANLARADRRPPRIPARRPHDVRGADRRPGRCHRLGRRRHPLDAASLRAASCSSGAGRSSPRCATSPRSNSSTAAAPDRWS